MAQVQLDTIKLIVENSMRKNGYSGGTIENAWKQVIPTPDGKTVTLQLNLQNLRDSISQSIYDTMSNTLVAGTTSVASIAGTQNVVNASSTTGDVSIYAVLPTNIPNPSPVGPAFPVLPFVLSNINLNYDTTLCPPAAIPVLPPVIGNKGAARMGDPVSINFASDPQFTNLFAQIMISIVLEWQQQGSYVNPTNPWSNSVTAIIAAFGSNPSPSAIEINGVVASGSNSVHIGD